MESNLVIKRTSENHRTIMRFLMDLILKERLKFSRSVLGGFRFKDCHFTAYRSVAVCVFLVTRQVVFLPVLRSFFDGTCTSVFE